METRSYNVYKFDELTPEQQAKAIDKYRNADTDALLWSIQNDEYMIEGLKEAGLAFDEMYWNTYPYQAGFNNIEVTDWVKLAKKIGLKRNSRLYRLLSDGSVRIEFNESRESSISYISWDDYRDIDDIRSDDDDKIAAFCQQLKNLIQDYESEAAKWIRNTEEWIYSDEYIIETIKANDYDFMSDGSIA